MCVGCNGHLLTDAFLSYLSLSFVSLSHTRLIHIETEKEKENNTKEPHIYTKPLKERQNKLRNIKTDFTESGHFYIYLNLKLSKFEKETPKVSLKCSMVTH